MSLMKAVYTDVQYLAETALAAVMTDSVDELGEALAYEGWVSPTEASVALRALREGDLVRVAALLTPTPRDPLGGPQEVCS